ncbi:MAG TPA: sugar phosphate isomerase/epimerase family protein [Syntrophales bacterium]|nr:sugar phosphate isomerase/epimerase family protein [Syntrophales bacterium]
MFIIGGRAHSIEQIHEVGKLGYHFAEISLYMPDDVERDLDELLKLKALYGMDYLAHYPNEDDAFDAKILEERFVPRMKKLIGLSQALGITKGTFHFWMDDRYVSHETIARKVDLAGEMVGTARTSGVTLCIENLSERYYHFTPMFERIPDLRMTLDIGHAQLLSKVNTSFGFIENYFSRIEHVHIHDNRGGKSPKDDFHLPLGEGTVDYPRILSLLQKKGYQSTVSMEVKIPDMAKTRDAILHSLA